MEFRNSQSYRCLICLCLWSLLSDLIVIISFFASYAFSFHYHDWAYVGWIVPLLVKLFLVFCFSIAIGYFAYIVYSEFKKHELNLPFGLIIKTEEIFNKIVKNNTFRNIIISISIFSFILNMFILVVNLFTILTALIAFGIFTVIFKK